MLEQILHIKDKNGISRCILLPSEAEVVFGIQWLEWNSGHNTILDKLEVRYMGDKLGWGLFSHKLIEEGETLGVFTGEIRFQDRDAPVCSEHVFLSDAPHHQFQVIDATKTGNITRFMQHLPTEEMLEDIVIAPQSKTILSDIATANIKKMVVPIGNGNFSEQYVTTQAIQPGQLIGCCYDMHCWLTEPPLLLKKNGGIVDVNDYVYPNKSPRPHNERRYLRNKREAGVLQPKIFKYFVVSLTASLGCYILYKKHMQLEPTQVATPRL